MTKAVKKYLFNLAVADLNSLKHSLESMNNFLKRDDSLDKDYWQRRANATENKIELVKKALKELNHDQKS
jgi:hypothetical protein